ncbi:hypothetical protein A2U01_0111392, partial [Trifolium medium]|nr:hypothetical protein [Trifolium medium]
EAKHPVSTPDYKLDYLLFDNLGYSDIELVLIGYP